MGDEVHDALRDAVLVSVLYHAKTGRDEAQSPIP